jgi:hypothetical protein
MTLLERVQSLHECIRFLWKPALESYLMTQYLRNVYLMNPSIETGADSVKNNK